MKRDYWLGCSCEHVIFSHFYYLPLSLLDNCFKVKGCALPSKLHTKAEDSSVAKRYYSLRLRLTLLIERHDLLGNICFKLAETKGYSDCRCGMSNCGPLDRTKYLCLFSKTFHSLMVLELEVINLRYFPCGRSQLMWLMASPMSVLLKVSNYR